MQSGEREDDDGTKFRGRRKAGEANGGSKVKFVFEITAPDESMICSGVINSCAVACIPSGTLKKNRSPM